MLQLTSSACVAQGVGTAEDIDKGMKLGTNHPMGPLQLADFIGVPSFCTRRAPVQSCGGCTGCHMHALQVHHSQTHV